MLNLKTIFFILFLFPLSTNAASSIAILDWREESMLTSTGKKSEILIEAKAVNLAPNQFIKSFAVGLGQGRNIKITKVICNRQPVDYSFNNNFLEVKFPQVRKNNDAIWINFAYEEIYPKINKFLRQEIISIPAFASGAKAKVTINFPGSLESATLNPNLTKTGNSFIYSNIVPKAGVQELIKLTSAQDIWDVVARAEISSNQPLENAIVSIPIYFENAGQRVSNLDFKSSTSPVKKYIKSNKNILEFNTQEKEIFIENRAKINTGENFKRFINRDPKQYLSSTNEEYQLLKPVLDKIIQSNKYKKLPVYAKIGEFVHEYIKYDSRYINKLPKIDEILQNPIGVCTEYATLYNSLARIAKIPAIIVTGVACGEYNKCEGHAWNMIYVNNQWISVDPTWNLMSGIVSSSHIYFSDNDNSKIQVRYFGSKKTVNSKMDLKIKNIPN